MRKTILVWAVVLCFMLSLGGCGKKESEYTNMADQISENEVLKELESCGITQEQTERVKKWITDFNATAQNFPFRKGLGSFRRKGWITAG